MRIGLVKEALAKSTPEIAALVRAAATKLQKSGALVEEVSLDMSEIGNVPR